MLRYYIFESKILFWKRIFSVSFCMALWLVFFCTSLRKNYLDRINRLQKVLFKGVEYYGYLACVDKIRSACGCSIGFIKGRVAWVFEIFPKRDGSDFSHEKEGVGKIGGVALKKGKGGITYFHINYYFTPETLKYWTGVQRGQSYLMGRRCLFNPGWPPFLWWCHDKNTLGGRCSITSTSLAPYWVD